VVGPFGAFTLRESRECDLVFVGGGAGMAPILSLLRTLAAKDSTRRATFYYGARRRRDLCFEKELAELETHLPGFRYVPALSEPDEEAWDGEVGFITDVLRRHQLDLTDVDSYVCGPPPMVEAAMEVLGVLGASEKRIYYDKFTTTAPS
jgi:propane monooxygenase reductase subunit